ncbi:hypothetical protein QBC46DRAFT_339196 [Diplogelasinospora grovesii]|uniref:Ankyrin repeat protein n=1 Tax=Diplogelasinospora grovesii TaxID=303347 RepID=A0AAN6S7A8_9PEZI|nr:hypothetical protein QBC46DRAFT_339196 [Diplogelasinospora grovesii]
MHKDDGQLQVTDRVIELARECKTTSKLERLLWQSHTDANILHVLLAPDTYDEDVQEPFDFTRTPVFQALGSRFPRTAKQEITQCLCEMTQAGVEAPLPQVLDSLIQQGRGPEKRAKERTALHEAIKNGISIDEKKMGRLRGFFKKQDRGGGDTTKEGSSTSPLATRDRDGRTLLHLALTPPLTGSKAEWAKSLAKLEPDLLKMRMEAPDDKGVAKTPLQHLADKIKTRGREKDKRKNRGEKGRRGGKTESRAAGGTSLEDVLKLECLRAFDDNIAKSIIYEPENVRETYLPLLGSKN